MGNKANSLPASKNSIHMKRIWVPVFMMLGISILSGSSGVQTGPISFVGIDKLGHFIVFGLLGIAWIRTFNRQGTGFGLAVVLTTLFGLLDEWHQFYNPERYFEWADLAADFIGAVVFSTSYCRIPALRKVLEREIWVRRA